MALVEPAAAGVTTRISVAPSGLEANGESRDVALSADGRWIAFSSDATNLVPGDPGSGLFLHDRVAGTTVRLAEAPLPPQVPLFRPVISADGAYVTFRRHSGRGSPIAVYERASGTITDYARPFGSASPFEPQPISDDGRYVSLSSDDQVYVLDRSDGTFELGSANPGGNPANQESHAPAMSGDGRWLAFWSWASDFVPGDTNRLQDVYLRDRDTGTVIRASVGTGGVQGVGDEPNGEGLALSGDGRLIAFASRSNLAPPAPLGYVIYLHDRVLGTTVREDVASDGTAGNSDSTSPALSPDGRFLAFTSYARNLVPADVNGTYDVFLRDRVLGTTTRVSVGTRGTEGNYYSGGFISSSLDEVGLSSDGRFVAFQSAASNLVGDDTNAVGDIFLHDRGAICGNGTIEAGEVCDDANTGDGDGCDGDCRPTLCVGGGTITGGQIKIAPLTGPRLRTLTLRADLVLPPGVPATLDPLADGLQVRVEDIGGGGIVALTSPARAVPGGAVGTACGPRDGWKRDASGRTFAYKNVSGSLDLPECSTGSASGLVQMKISDKRSTKGTIQVRLKSKGLPQAPVVGPLRMTLVLGGSAAGAAGECAAHAFSELACGVRGASYACR